MNKYFRLLVLLIVTLAGQQVMAENGYDLWLRYREVSNETLKSHYDSIFSKVYIQGDMGSTGEVIKDELDRAVSSAIGKTPEYVPLKKDARLIISCGSTGEGFTISSQPKAYGSATEIRGDSPVGALYGVFMLLRDMQTGKRLDNQNRHQQPEISLRVLNHWDNLNGTIERGYAGYSLWNWERLAYDTDPRLIDYARANASIGINGVVVNNVNASARSLDRVWLVRLKRLADAWRPYGIKVYLTAKFSAPIEIGNLPTADPSDKEVAAWWKKKADEIYSLIPDFGGFLVKANSEGQPGPQDYGQTHAQGANMLAEALEPHGGVVFWRAFVYHNDHRRDRVASSYEEFYPLDGQFKDNVVLQVKNGAVDFQPREPFHPLFGGMDHTSVGMEFQITQENLGHAGHLVYLGKLFSEVLLSDTDGEGKTVADVLRDGKISAIAGVPNIGSEINWTGHPFGQANWYSFGRLCWNPEESPEDIAEEWIRLTFTGDDESVETIRDMMIMSREAVVNYEMPLGLNHIMNYDTHNGPEPWHHDPVWSAYDYHKITCDSIGIDRTVRGTGVTTQYRKRIRDKFDNLSECPDEYLLWFHRLPWDYRMRSGRTLWNEIVHKYNEGVNQVEIMISNWDSVSAHIDSERHKRVAALLRYQLEEAKWWRDGCLLFFDSYAKKGIPAGYPQPAHSLQYYKSIPFPYEWDGYFN